METLGHILTVVFAIAVVTVSLLFVYVILQAVYYPLIHGPALKRDLGFVIGSACLPHQSGLLSPYTKALSISTVTRDGVFERAGLRSGDVLPELSEIQFFKLLHRHRGRVAELAVVDGGEGPPFIERPRRFVKISVPPREASV